MLYPAELRGLTHIQARIPVSARAALRAADPLHSRSACYDSRAAQPAGLLARGHAPGRAAGESRDIPMILDTHSPAIETAKHGRGRQAFR